VSDLTVFCEYNRSAIKSGEAWRIVTGHLVHWNLDHLVWDLGMFAVLGGLCEMRNSRIYVVCLAASALFISMTM